MPPLIAIGVAITALGLLGMVVALSLPVTMPSRFSDRLFDIGYGLFTIALTYWLCVSAVAFFATARVHAL